MEYPKNLLEFGEFFPNEQECRKYLLNLRFVDGYTCGKCGGKRYWSQTRTRLTCTKCRSETTPFANTIFHKSHLPLRVWFHAAWWLTNQKQGVNALGLQRALGLGSYRTAWLMLHKLRTATLCPGRELLTGEVEVDETMIGGIEPIAAYRDNKTSVLIAAEKDGRKIGRIRMKVIPNNRTAVLLKSVQEFVKTGSTVETDGWSGYIRLRDIGYRHIRTITDKDVRQENVLPRVHRVASLLKRWLLGTYHGRHNPQHLQNYLDEFVFRFNRRTSLSRGLLFRRLLENAWRTKAPTYAQIINRPHPNP